MAGIKTFGIDAAQRVKVELVSPPLLPLSPIATPYLPSPDTAHPDLLSDHTSPTGEEAYEVERKVFENDAIILPKKAGINSPLSDPTSLESDSLGDIYSPLKGIKDPPSSPPPLRAPLRERKVEVPLSPLNLERTPLSKKKRVSFSETIPELISNLPPPIPKPENTSSSDIDAFFDESIAPIGVKAERTIEQEQLQEEDTTLRVLVPVMDFSLPIAPWKANFRASIFDDEGKWYTMLLAEMKALHFSKHVWPMSGKAERELRWAPFPLALGRVESQERIFDDGSTTNYWEKPERIDVTTLTWKPEGLRLLDDLADSDDELEEGWFPEETNFEFLVKKRKLELDELQCIPSGSDEGNNMLKKTPSSKRHTAAVLLNENLYGTTKVDEVTKIDTDKRPFIDAFSTLGALDEFLSIRKGLVHKTKLLKAEHYFPTSSSTPPLNPPEQTSENDIPAPVSKRQNLASPDISSPTNPTPFVIAATLLSIRPLFRRIEHLFPSAVFIERDFSLHLPSPQRPHSKYSSNPLPHSPSPKHTTAPLLTNTTIADEADLLLSPSTALIHTTLQKIKQRSLPGHVSHSAIRERVLRTSPRYERLLILVSENRHDGASQLDNGDSTALIEFTAFCSNVTGSEVHVTFLAGGEEDLAKWIVAMMIKYAVAEHEDVKLIQNETLWEIWLRRAGMNAFAAQAVLGRLKAGGSCVGADDWEKGDGFEGEWGLKAFVKMSALERNQRFEVLLGGRRVLKRVGEVVDGRW